jgi:preprotein translocase subunit SecD
MLGDNTVAIRRGSERSCGRRRLTVVWAVTFALLVASALVSLSPTPGGFRAPTAGAAGVHTSSVSAVADRVPAGKPATAPRYLLGPSVITPTHHDAKHVTSKNSSSTVHIVFTQAGAERWDAVTSANLLKDATLTFGDHVPSDPIVEPTNYSFSTFDGKVQISFGNLSAAQAHQYASSL